MSGADDADEANRTVDSGAAGSDRGLEESEPPVESVSSGEPELSDGDLVVRASLDKANRLKARHIWTARSSAYGCFRSIHKGEELANLSPDLQAAYSHVGDLRQAISQSLSLDAAYNRELMIPMQAEGQRHHMRTITLAVRRMIQAQFAKWACGPLPGRVPEAGVMREDWDGLFDPLTSGIVYTGPAEETVLASKARKVAEADSTNRGKQADKCWKLASGLEVCWLEAAKEDDAKNPTKYESDLLKHIQARCTAAVGRAPAVGCVHRAHPLDSDHPDCVVPCALLGDAGGPAPTAR
ncbi:hypothetical protein HDU88_008969 [Geranomyces variabilis]|nr:hypothetical protein HDU88_008969 [Geranomyces variabilis]